MTRWSRLGSQVAELLEVLGGSRARPASWSGGRAAVAWGIWWLVLFVLAASFAGRATKFVYVDF